ncbi:hypothetical protein P691DRAFT_769342 [Macrolepiota fuliginosa MF-IS2]|uniref:Uncharacterized protein n=1 Tax=Macrolepiota fuliginosa MF-IS2 TaxID=1400762 RepID=A0A9P5WXI8_9AGAR|nr:hypothetical protein P691DRAFT_769342 [Macrolepiota fuliginosa MF-IS2]
MNSNQIKLWLREPSEVQEWEEVPGHSSKPTSTPPPPWMDNSNLNWFLQMVWTKVPYSHIYTYAQYGWRKIVGTENYIHAYLHGNPLDTHICLGPCHLHIQGTYK